MGLENNKKIGVSGPWVGGLDDYSDAHTVLVCRFIQMGHRVVGDWSEKRVSDLGSHSFNSNLSGSFNGEALSLLENRNDTRLFRIHLNLVSKGRRLEGEWQALGRKEWFPIKLTRLGSGGGLEIIQENKKHPQPLPLEHYI